jgi:hypothetical protein
MRHAPVKQGRGIAQREASGGARPARFLPLYQTQMMDRYGHVFNANSLIWTLLFIQKVTGPDSVFDTLKPRFHFHCNYSHTGGASMAR